MSRFRIHRSLLFWAGVLVMGFIGWGWWHSTRELKSAARGDWVVMNFESRVSFGRVRIGRGGWHVPLDFLSSSDLEGSKQMQLAVPRLLRHLGGEFFSETDPVRIKGMDSELPSFDELYPMLGRKGDWLCQVPHWLLLLGFAVPWAGVLVWLRRRQRRTGAVIADGEAETA